MSSMLLIRMLFVFLALPSCINFVMASSSQRASLRNKLVDKDVRKPTALHNPHRFPSRCNPAITQNSIGKLTDTPTLRHWEDTLETVTPQKSRMDVKKETPAEILKRLEQLHSGYSTDIILDSSSPTNIVAHPDKSLTTSSHNSKKSLEVTNVENNEHGGGSTSALHYQHTHDSNAPNTRLILIFILGFCIFCFMSLLAGFIYTIVTDIKPSEDTTIMARERRNSLRAILVQQGMERMINENEIDTNGRSVVHHRQGVGINSSDNGRVIHFEEIDML